MAMISSTTRDLLAIASAISIGLSWVLLNPGSFRNIALASSVAIFIIMMWGIRNINKGLNLSDIQTQVKNTIIQQSADNNTENISTNIDPNESLENCLRYYRILNHPASERLRRRVDDYRQIVIKLAKERSGNGTMWRDPDEDIRVRSCLCGQLTRDEVIHALDLEIVENEPPLVGAGMGIAPVLAGESRTRGTIIAEDGHPATRELIDPIVDESISELVSHRPEAKQALMAVRDRYTENIIRRLIGPLDDRGNAIVPLCRWRRRFDGSHYNDYERLEGEFTG